MSQGYPLIVLVKGFDFSLTVFATGSPSNMLSTLMIISPWSLIWLLNTRTSGRSKGIEIIAGLSLLVKNSSSIEAIFEAFLSHFIAFSPHFTPFLSGSPYHYI